MCFSYKHIIISALLYSLIYSETNKNLSCEPLSLSHIKANEVTAILNGMGYSVIEFNKADTLDYYSPTDSIGDLPAIINFPFSKLGYLDNYNSNEGYDDSSSDFNLSGSSFPELLSSNPLEQILICYDFNSKDKYYDLIEYVKNILDISARQVMIDAMVIEINSSDLDEIKLETSEAESDSTITNILGSINSLSLSLNENGLYTEAGKRILDEIDMKITAIIKNTSAEILSNPSILVLDGRQARIQVGEQIPISKLPMSNAQDLFIVPDVEYLPVGITLNLRPRISDDNKHVTMQVETIITEVDTDYSNSESTVIDAPIINNRKIESFVKLANNTPFIVGGLISNSKSRGDARLPFLSKIPFIGNLFKSNSSSSKSREVIVVITPHVIEENYNQFSKVVPQDSEIFNSFGSILFSNSYRLKDSDIFDLDFIVDSNALATLRNKVNEASINGVQNDDNMKKIIDGYIPGEEILVRRMIYEIIKSSEYYSHINPKNVIFFDNKGIIRKLQDYDKIVLNDKQTLLLKLENSNIESNFKRPYIHPKSIKINNDYLGALRELNKKDKSILLANKAHRRILLESIILKHLLEMNEDLELNLASFKRGMEIQFPNPSVFEDNIHLIDPDIISYFYEINDYYHAFEVRFDKALSKY